MGFSEAVQWWEEWQLRVLVLASLFLQYFLFVAAPSRKCRIPPWFRFMIWLAYLGSDAVAIYALAALFNRHKKQEWVSTHRDDASLEALWAPILLVHLGGVDAITAYNIEDNELWRRHVLTAVSQTAVAIYVFHKSWPGDERLLEAGILIFVAGILRCFEKPVALKSASISSIVSSRRSSSSPGRNMTGDGSDDDYDLLEDGVYYAFVDMAPSKMERAFYDEDVAIGCHECCQIILRNSFQRLYTKEQVSGSTMNLLLRLILQRLTRRRICGYLLRLVVNPMIFAALGLFHRRSHREAYNSVDVKVTYTLLSCTAALEYIGPLIMAPIATCYHAGCRYLGVLSTWPDQIAQYNLIGYLLASTKKHRILKRTKAFLGCEDYLDPLWYCMEPSELSSDITYLVRGYIKKWKATNSRGFNDNRGHWVLMSEGLGGSSILWGSIRRPFDESVLIWHLATEFCYFERLHHAVTEASWDDARYSRVMSNYMAHLLFTNPEMLMTGARPMLFRDAYRNLKGIPLEDEGEPAAQQQEEELAKKIIHKLKGGVQDEGVARDAWVLSKDLMDSCEGDDKKMWRVIEGVWVEMLCFSAGRCRGYLHAKSLGKGGEYLSYIWLLLTYMGVETLAQKMQRTDLQEEGGCNGGGSHRTTSATPATTTIGNGNV